MRQQPAFSHSPYIAPVPSGPALRFREALRAPRSLPVALGLALAMLSVSQAEAGDILRGGTPLGGGGGNGTGGPLTPAAQAARQNAKDALARTTQALNSVKAMQNTARAAAIAGPNRLGANLANVTNGLGRGGLQVAAGVPKNLSNPQTGEDVKLWTGALLPRETKKGGESFVTIQQTKSQAVLNWETFNVGKKTTLRFDQSKGGEDRTQWTAFNKIKDPSGKPSQILGKIEGDGQVYVINANGILFGGSSQINLHGLVASSLPINDGLVARGLLNNPDSQFLFSALPLSAGKNGTAAFTPVASDAPGGKYGDVVVQEGAQLTSPSTGSGVGGRIMLVGPNVSNAGTISTPDGQTVLAAGLQVGFAAHSSNDARLRGLDTFIGAVSVPPPATPQDPPIIPAQNPAGTAINTGLLDTPRANATLAGKDVRQLGIINSATSVSLNGSINLLANFGAVTVVPSGSGSPFFATTGSGTATIGADAVNQILPDSLDPKTVIGTQLALRSKVVVEGRNIHFGTNSTLLAPNADVILRAGEWRPNGEDRQLVFSTGQIYIDTGAVLNVAGTADVTVPIARNILSLELRGAELADAPLQRKGPLRGPTLNLDIRQRGTFAGREWVGTPLGEVSGYANLIERSVSELTTAGGNITITAGNSVVVRSGAKLDVSGGYVNFEGGVVQTTRVISDNRVVDIANAFPDRPFTGLYDGTFTKTLPKYGISQTWAHPLSMSGDHFEPGYVEGSAGGAITIKSAGVALDGDLRGQVIAGPRQRTALAAPRLSTLALTFEKQDSTSARTPSPDFSPTPANITFQAGQLSAPGEFRVDAAGHAAPLGVERLAQVLLSPELFTSAGFGFVTVINSDGELSVPEDVELKVPARGGLTLTGSNINVQGKVSAPGGALSFTAYNITPYTDQTTPAGTPINTTPNLGRGTFTLGPSGSLNVAGLVVDDRPLAKAPLGQPLAADAGSIAIAGYNVDLSAGSALDASGGVLFDRSGRRTYGAGGGISIKAGNDPRLTQVLGGTLTLDAKLSAFSGGKGGSLAIQAPSIQVGGEVGATLNTLLVQSEFFSQGGFTSFALTGLGEAVKGSTTEFIPAVAITAGTQLKPIALNSLAVPYGPGLEGAELRPILGPQSLRTPVSLAFNAPGLRDDQNGNALVTRGDIVVGVGAHIETDPRGTVSFTGETVSMLGSVVAPGGRISISGSRNLSSAFLESAKSLTSVHLGPDALLSTRGTVLYTPNLYGFRTGSVLPGGQISISGNIVAETGAVLDVSGTSGIIDTLKPTVEMGGNVTGLSVVPLNSGVNSALYTQEYVATRFDSDAGDISLTGGQHLFMDATLLGAAGGPTALGGTLTVSSDRFFPVGTVKKPTDVTLRVTQSGPTLPAAFAKLGGSAIGLGVEGVASHGYFAADTFSRGGFDSLTLRGTVEFAGPVSIAARRTLSVADAGVLYADAAVTLKAPYITLGQPFLAPLAFGSAPRTPFLDGAGQPVSVKPTHGTGELTVIADLIDIGNLSLQSIDTARFIADGGDIRGNGTLEAAGHISLRAAQVYPPSATTFTIIAADYKVGSETRSGSISFEASGVRALPLSAGGTLNVFASSIVQNGTLRVPLGTINLGWNGEGDAPVSALSGDKAAATKNITLGADSFTSVSAISPIEGQDLVVPFGLNINGVTWVDPTGTDITGGGVAQKAINIAGANVDSKAGSRLDIRGGGDLLSYRWVAGPGGSRDLLASATSFAILPGYGAHFSPYAPNSAASALTGDPGLINTALRVGDCIHLGAGAGLEEGNYTLLPARYALLPGARLVSLKGGTPIGTLELPDGSTLVPGFRFNGLNAERTLNSQLSWFEVLSPEALSDRAAYVSYTGNEFLRTSALQLEAKVPRLPGDAGQLTLQASSTMILNGRVAAGAPSGSRGGLVDIASPSDIVITGEGGTAGPGKLSLDAAQLSSFGAESLLIGGIRKVGPNSTTITVKTGNLTVDNGGTPLSSPEIILVANKALTLTAGAEILQTGTLQAGGDTLALTGDGTLIRVTSDADARTTRTGLGGSTEPRMTIGAGAHIAGANVTLDSTYGTSLDPSARLDAGVIAINSGQISIQLENPGALNPTDGLILGGTALASLEKSGSVSLLSYSTFDIYGTGTFNIAGTLTLHARAIRGFNNDGGTTTISAGALILDNSAAATFAAAPGTTSGALELKAGTITLGKGQLSINQYAVVNLSASGGILATGNGGLSAQGNIVAETPIITAARSAVHGITAGGELRIDDAGAATVQGGLGASLTLQGSSVSIGSDISLPSGLLTVRATTGDVSIAGRVNLSGAEQTFYDLTRFTGGGEVRLTADNGSVNINAGSVISVSAPGGADAGRLTISAPKGSFTNAGEFVGKAVAGGRGGTFTLDAGMLADFTALQVSLATGGFSEAQSFRIRTGDVAIGGTVKVNDFRLSTDTGSITISGTVDVSGQHGGNIALLGGGSVIISGALDASGQDFSAAGKGGSISLETRGLNAGVVDIQSGATIDLGVASADADSEAYGRFTGTLHLRAPQNAASTDLSVAPIAGTITGASAIIVEGYKVFTPNGGNITIGTQTQISNNGKTFVGADGTASATYGTMLARVLGANTALDPVLSIRPGAEIVSTTGNLTLGNATTSTYANDWNLATFRFGTKHAPGVLTLRAFGNISLFNTISDGFQTAAWDATLLSQNTALSANAQSWSYRFTAGADLAAADFAQVRALSSLAADSGSLLLGKDAGNGVSITPGTTGATTPNSIAVSNAYQVIRTGSGDISIAAARDVQLRNQYASIFTVGTKLQDASTLPNGGAFDVPEPMISGSQGTLVASNLGVDGRGGVTATAQSTVAGGNVSVTAQNDIVHNTKLGGVVSADSTRQMPTSWLYRRGNVDALTGEFATSLTGTSVDSTTWWVDFSNFFEGVGALGGGNVSLIAGRDVANVDGVIPTNARMAKGAPDAANLVELGGGDLTVRAGRNIDGGVYYVERGHGALDAGGEITTNRTRTPSLGIITDNFAPEQTWLPTTFFLGKGSIAVNARGNVLMGPVANPFLLPAGYYNSIRYKSYFSTYAAESAVSVTSLGGGVTLRLEATPVSLQSEESEPILMTWYRKHMQFGKDASVYSTANYQPWLALNETNTAAFKTAFNLMPATLRASAFSGDINVIGKLTLAPSAKGTLELLANGAVNGLNIAGRNTVEGTPTNLWVTGSVVLSDASPTSVPGAAAPLGFLATVPAGTNPVTTGTAFYNSFNALFAENGALTNALDTKQALHAPGLLHAGDADPLRIYAGTGDIQGLSVFSPKAANIFAGRDISDIGLYIQNLADEDVSIVAAGRDIIAYNANTASRVTASSAGNAITSSSAPRAGDLQISGPGTLEVLAGRNLDLGIGKSNADRTGLGLVSVGNARNTNLPFAGADLVVGAGIGPATGLGTGALDFKTFVADILAAPAATRYAEELATIIGGSGAVTDFESLPEKQQHLAALQIFFLMLRDAGRDHNDPASPDFGTYAGGFKAIDTLFPGTNWKGDISLTSRQIKTAAGGDISIFAPGGKIIVGFDAGAGQSLDQGILTESGGNIHIFANDSVTLGTSRIFTLRGGNEIIWSTTGDIAAGSSSKTVASAPPTRVSIDPQSADLKNDLAGLATGGGIGVLATVAGLMPGDVDLIAPGGAIDAGDAGIRSAGNLNVAATTLLNSENISVTGATAGAPSAPPPPPPPPPPTTVTPTDNKPQTSGQTEKEREREKDKDKERIVEEAASIFNIEVLGYGGGEGPSAR